MPFKSKSQLRTCYSKQKENWDCDEFLDATESVSELPEHVGEPNNRKCRPMKKSDRIVGEVQEGPRGGKFFIIYEGECETKIYLPKDYIYPKKSSSRKKSVSRKTSSKQNSKSKSKTKGSSKAKKGKVRRSKKTKKSD